MQWTVFTRTLQRPNDNVDIPPRVCYDVIVMVIADDTRNSNASLNRERHVHRTAVASHT